MNEYRLYIHTLSRKFSSYCLTYIIPYLHPRSSILASFSPDYHTALGHLSTVTLLMTCSQQWRWQQSGSEKSLAQRQKDLTVCADDWQLNQFASQPTTCEAYISSRRTTIDQCNNVALIQDKCATMSSIVKSHISKLLEQEKITQINDTFRMDQHFLVIEYNCSGVIYSEKKPSILKRFKRTL